MVQDLSFCPMARDKQVRQLGKWILAEFASEFCITSIENYQALLAGKVKTFGYVEPCVF